MPVRTRHSRRGGVKNSGRKPNTRTSKRTRQCRTSNRRPLGNRNVSRSTIPSKSHRRKRVQQFKRSRIGGVQYDAESDETPTGDIKKPPTTLQPQPQPEEVKNPLQLSQQAEVESEQTKGKVQIYGNFRVSINCELKNSKMVDFIALIDNASTFVITVPLNENISVWDTFTNQSTEGCGGNLKSMQEFTDIRNFYSVWELKKYHNITICLKHGSNNLLSNENFEEFLQGQSIIRVPNQDNITLEFCINEKQ